MPEENSTVDATAAVPAIRRLLDIARRRADSPGAVRSSSPLGIRVTTLMRAVGVVLQQKLDLKPLRLDVQISKGMSNLPNILWIAVVPLGKTVSSSVCACICIGKRGEGVVVGVMRGGFMTLPGRELVDRRKSGIRVDVDGPRPESSYNNKFYNPLELLASELEEDPLISHLRDSIALMRGA